MMFPLSFDKRVREMQNLRCSFLYPPTACVRLNAKHFSKISDAWPEKWIARNKPSAAANTHKIRTIFLTVMIFPHPKPSQEGSAGADSQSAPAEARL
jgi:hypothetical protein